MICSICSLLCDAADLDQLDCNKRNQALVQLAEIRTAQETSISAEATASYRERLATAANVLIAGRIASVQTARAAIALAKSTNATIDCCVEGHAFKNILAIQRSGLNSVSIAEARDHTHLFIVVGDDELLNTSPRMPYSLAGNTPQLQTVLLLGQFNRASIERWQNAGFRVWSIACKVTDVPKALLQWFDMDSNDRRRTASEIPTDGENVEELYDLMESAQYTTVVWSAQNLDMSHADLWVERLLQWIAKRNETTRCAGLPWSSLDGTFQQVCTWLTGFPGRVRFHNGVPSYDPDAHSIQSWIERFATADDGTNMVVWIDETLECPSDSLPKRLVDGNTQCLSLSVDSEEFPVLAAGIETASDTFRADQTLLARVQPTLPKGAVQARPAADWIARLQS